MPMFYHEKDSLQEIIELMVACEQLGLDYVVQKDYVVKQKWFKSQKLPVYKLQIIQYTEGEVDEVLQGRPSESQEEYSNE